MDGPYGGARGLPAAGDVPAGADVGAIKARLRRELLRGRADRVRSAAGDDAAKAAADEARTALALALPELAAARCVAAYAALPGEPPTAGLLAALRARGALVLLPSVSPDRDLVFLEYAGELRGGRLGTLEPPAGAAAVDLARADVIVVPALAVDAAGRRLGRGGGSYDRALTRARADTTVVALLGEPGLVREVPVEAHDRPVDVVVTELRVIRARPGDGATASVPTGGWNA
jgi:5-formyltetrahydrofolate cyclo-ligase